MRSIKKGNECRALRDWKNSNAASPQNIHYDNLSGVVKSAILSKLIVEQGGLCAYTMKNIKPVNGIFHAHIEHIFPRSAYQQQTVNWNNLVACFPLTGQSCDYGAIRKADYDPGSKPFVNPTKAGVSNQFRYLDNGEVDGLTSDAVACIDKEVLNLNHPNLVNDRRAKILGALQRQPSATQARQRAQQLRKFDTQGFLEPYCEAVAQVLDNYALRLERRAARISGVRRG